MITNAEIVGVGPMWQGSPHPGGRAEYPAPYPAGTAIGQHLRVERLLRISENRHYYLVNNLGPKWNRRKCWACGNKYTPNTGQSCDYCMTPLRDLRFIMTARWNRDEWSGFQQFVQARVKFFGLVAPVALIYRGPYQLAVYHYHNEGLLLDEPSPLPPHTLLAMAHQLAEIVHNLHDHGVVLRRLTSHNVLRMPDGSTRLFDLEPHGILGNREALSSHRRRPILSDTRRLGELLLSYSGPDYVQLQEFFGRARDGAFDNPGLFAREIERMLFSGGARVVDSRCASYTDVGLVRDHNEDSWGWTRLSEAATLYVVADGMGGHEDGAEASRLAIDAVRRSLTEKPPLKNDAKAVEKRVEAAIKAANAAVFAHAKQVKLKMGTTLVLAVLIDDKTLVVGNAGDSRCYRFRLGSFEQLSIDHSIVAELVDAGRLSKEEARTHKNSHILTTTVGGEKQIEEFDVVAVDVRPGDRLLLCSDGLWGELEEDAIAYHLGSQPDRRHCIQALVRAAYEAGGTDNIAVSIIDIP